MREAHCDSVTRLFGRCAKDPDQQVWSALESDSFLREVKPVTLSPNATPKTILAVDDNRAVLKLVQTILNGAGYEVLTADSATAAMLIEVAFQGTLHMLLSDV